MKELTIEQKAQRYDKALAKVRTIVNSINVGLIGKDSFEAVFPELKENKKESTDEKVRKALIKLVTNHASMDLFIEYGIHLDEALSWLEKQGKNNMGISESVKQKLEDNLSKALEKETPESYNEFLDEQGEQKPTDDIERKYNPCYNMSFEEAQEYISNRGFDIPWTDCDVFVDFRYVTQTVANILRWADDNPKQKPADKAEPKFKVKYAGSEYNVLEVKDIAGVTFYGIEDEPNHIDYILPNNCEIVSEQNPWSEEDEKYLSAASMYIYCTAHHGNIEKNEVIHWLKSLKERVLPQLKEEWSEDDEKILSDIIKDLVHPWNEYIPDRIEEEIKWLKNRLKSLKGRIQSKQEWSEEDEDNFKHLLDEIVCLGNNRNSANRLYYDKLIKFIEELKNRAQPKEKWCDKDEKMLDRLIAYFEKQVAFTDDDNPRYANWLKSLRPQNTWKPSDEQMEALKGLLELINQKSMHGRELISLIEQLKKLKG